MASYGNAPAALSPDQVFEIWKSEKADIENACKKELARLEEQLARDKAAVEAEYERKRRVIPATSPTAQFMSQYLHDQQATELRRLEHKHASIKQELEKAYEQKKQEHMDVFIRRVDAVAKPPAPPPPPPPPAPAPHSQRPGRPPSISRASYDMGPRLEQQQQYPHQHSNQYQPPQHQQHQPLSQPTQLPLPHQQQQPVQHHDQHVGRLLHQPLPLQPQPQPQPPQRQHHHQAPHQYDQHAGRLPHQPPQHSSPRQAPTQPPQHQSPYQAPSHQPHQQQHSPPRQSRQLRQPVPQQAQPDLHQREQPYQPQHPHQHQQRIAQAPQQHGDRPLQHPSDHQHAQPPQRPGHAPNRLRSVEAPAELSRPANTQFGYNPGVSASASVPPPSSAPLLSRHVSPPPQYETRHPDGTQSRFWKSPVNTESRGPASVDTRIHADAERRVPPDAERRVPPDAERRVYAESNGPRYSPSQRAGTVPARPSVPPSHQVQPSPPDGFRPLQPGNSSQLPGPVPGPVPILASQPLPSPSLPAPEVAEPNQGGSKRKAGPQRLSLGQGPAKRSKAETGTPQTDTPATAVTASPRSAAASAPTPNVKRTISFDEVYQDGAPEHQAYHFIVEYPPGKGNWYILKCDEHGVYFNANPLHGAAKHLHSPQHDTMSKEHSQAIDKLGHLVFDCDAELAAKNNAVVKEYFSSGHKPFNRNQLTKTERVKRGLESPGARSPATPREYKPRGPQANPHVKAEPKYRTRNFAGITYPVPAELYLGYWSKNKTKYGVLVLPWRDLAPCGIAGFLKNTNLLARAPKCYVISQDGEIEGWAPGFEDGGPYVTKRDFPVMYYDGHRSVGWLRAKDLSSFPFKGGVSYSIPHFDEARESYAHARGFASFQEYNLDRQRRGLPEKTDSDVRDPIASPDNRSLPLGGDGAGDSPDMSRHFPAQNQNFLVRDLAPTSAATQQGSNDGRPRGEETVNGAATPLQEPEMHDVEMEDAALDDADSLSNHNSVTKDMAGSDDEAGMDDAESRLTSVSHKAAEGDHEHPGGDKTAEDDVRSTIAANMPAIPPAEVSEEQADLNSTRTSDNPSAARVKLPERPHKGFAAVNSTKSTGPTEPPGTAASTPSHSADSAMGSQISHALSPDATMTTDAAQAEKTASANPGAVVSGPEAGRHTPTPTIVRLDSDGQSSRWRAVRKEATANPAKEAEEVENTAKPTETAEPKESTQRAPSPALTTESKESSPLTPLTEGSTPVVPETVDGSDQPASSAANNTTTAIVDNTVTVDNTTTATVDNTTTATVDNSTVGTADNSSAASVQAAAPTRPVAKVEEDLFELAWYENTDGITWSRESEGKALVMATDTTNNIIKTTPGQSFDLTIDPNAIKSMTVEPLDSESQVCLVTLQGCDGVTEEKIVFEPSDIKENTLSNGRVNARRFLGWLNRRRNPSLNRMAYFNKTHNPLQKPITSYVPVSKKG